MDIRVELNRNIIFFLYNKPVDAEEIKISSDTDKIWHNKQQQQQQ